MMLVRKNKELIIYGEVKDKNVVPFFNLDKYGCYLAEVSFKENKTKIKLLKKYENNSIFERMYKKSLDLLIKSEK